MKRYVFSVVVFSVRYRQAVLSQLNSDAVGFTCNTVSNYLGFFPVFLVFGDSFHFEWFLQNVKDRQRSPATVEETQNNSPSLAVIFFYRGIKSWWQDFYSGTRAKSGTLRNPNIWISAVIQTKIKSKPFKVIPYNQGNFSKKGLDFFI